MGAVWTSEMLALEKQIVQSAQGQPRTILKSGCTLWHVSQILGQQTVLALDELGFVRTDSLGQTHGFKVRDLGVSPEADRVLVHLDVTDHQLFSPQSPKGRQGKPLAYVSLIGERVLEQLRIRASEALGGPVEVYPDNHYWVRYVYDLSRLLKGEVAFARTELVVQDVAFGGYNRCTFAGNLGADAELAYMGEKGTPKLTFSLGVNTGFGEHERTEWPRVVIIGKRAESLAAYMLKGTHVLVSGEQRTSVWEDEAGERHYHTELVIPPYSGELVFLGRKPAENAAE